jgi:hypothetical protein
MRNFVFATLIAAAPALAFAHSSPAPMKSISEVAATGGSVASSGASLNASNEAEQSSASNHGFSTTTVATNHGDTSSIVTTTSNDSGSVNSRGNGFATANESGSASTTGQAFGLKAQFGF